MRTPIGRGARTGDFLPAPTAGGGLLSATGAGGNLLFATGAGAAPGMMPVGPFYWNQNDQPRSFATRFIIAGLRTSHAAHATPQVAVHSDLPAVVVPDDKDAVLHNQKRRATPIHVAGHANGSGLHGRLAIALSRRRAKPPAAMHDNRDHYQQSGIIPLAEIERWLHRSGRRFGLPAGSDAAVLDKPRGFVLDLGSRQGKKVCCHVV
jgi:hypothetical protein